MAHLRGQAPARPGTGRGVDALVGGQQRHPGLLQLVLDLGAEVSDAGGPVDRLADHRDEAPVGSGGLGEQVRDAASRGTGRLNCSWVLPRPRIDRSARPDPTS